MSDQLTQGKIGVAATVGGSVAMVACVFVLIGCCIGAASYTSGVVKAAAAPRLVVIDYIRGGGK